MGFADYLLFMHGQHPRDRYNVVLTNSHLNGNAARIWSASKEAEFTRPGPAAPASPQSSFASSRAKATNATEFERRLVRKNRGALSTIQHPGSDDEREEEDLGGTRILDGHGTTGRKPRTQVKNQVSPGILSLVLGFD